MVTVGVIPPQHSTCATDRRLLKDAVSRTKLNCGVGKETVDTKDERSRRNRGGPGAQPNASQEIKMRIVGLVLAGALAASFATPGHADPLGSNMTFSRPVPSVGQLGHSNP